MDKDQEDTQQRSSAPQVMGGNGSGKGNLTLLTALASGYSIKEAAKRARIGERTAHRRIKDPRFQESIREMRTQVLSEAMGRLTDATTEAADTLCALLRAESDFVRLSAARAILEFAPKLRKDVELEKRMAQIEAKAYKDDEF